MTPNITSDLAVFAAFKSKAQQGAIGDALKYLYSFTIDEQTVREINAPGLLDEVQRFARSYEPQLNRRILITAESQRALPSVTEHKRAAYQLMHFDQFEDFPRCLAVLERFSVRAHASSVTAELAAWARRLSTDPAHAERISRHFDLSPSQ